MAGTGFITMTQSGEPESYINFNLLKSVSNPTGTLRTQSELGEYFWHKGDLNTIENVMPSLPELAIRVNKSPDLFFCELNYQL